MNFLSRLIVTVGAVIGGAVAGAIAVTILDLSLTGHGKPSINRPWIRWPAAGVDLSRGSAVMLLVSVNAGCLAWRRAGSR